MILRFYLLFRNYFYFYFGLIFCLFGISAIKAQPVTASDCISAENACTNIGFEILPNGFGSINELPATNRIANPWPVNPSSTNKGCLRDGEVNSTWIIINVYTSGWLEFTIGANPPPFFGSCYDWILWRYDSVSACSDITANRRAPLRCNWNDTCNAFTGMARPQYIPTGGRQCTFEPPLWVNCGEKYILCFSNHSSSRAVVPLDFFNVSGRNNAVVQCAPITEFNLRASADTVCSGQPLVLTATGAIPNTPYSWNSTASDSNTVRSYSSSVITVYPEPGPNNFIYTVSGNNPQCGLSYDTIRVHVLVPIRNNYVQSNQTICHGQSPAQIQGSVPPILSGGNGIYSYQWQSSLNNSQWNNISGATQANYNPSVLFSNTYFRRLVQSGPCSDGASFTVAITVLPPVGNNQISTSQTICLLQRPDSLMGTIPTGGNSQYTYQWQSSIDSILWIPIPGATLQHYRPPVLSMNTYFRRVVGSGPCTGNLSNTLTIRVLPPISGDTIMAHQTICQGLSPSQFTGSLPSGGNNAFSFTWQLAPDSIGLWSVISGATNQNHQHGVLMDTAFFRRLVVSGPCRDTTSWIRVIVHTPPSPNTLIQQQTICRGTAFQPLTGSLPSGGNGSYAYSWQSSTNNSTWGTMSSATGTNLPGFALNQTTWFRRVVSSPPCFAITSASLQIKVDSLIGNNTLLPSQTLCQGANPISLNGTSPSGGSQPYSYQWESSPNRTNWFPIVGASNPAYNPGPLTSSAYFRRIVSGGPCTPHTSDSVLITIHPLIGNNSISPAQSICAGTPATILQGTVPTGGSGSYQYQWQSSTNQSSWTLVPGMISQSYSPGLLNASVYFRRIVISPPCANSTSAAVFIQVEPRPGNNLIASSQTLCAGQSPALLTGTQPTGGSGQYVYQWQSSANQSSWSTESASSSFQPGPLSANTYYRRILSSGACPNDTSLIISITVLPPFGNNLIGINQTLCLGSPALPLTGTLPTGGNGTYNYQWQSSTNTSTWAIITGAQQVNYTPGTPAASVYFRRFVQSGECQDNSLPVWIAVQVPITGNTVTSAQTICSGSSPGFLVGGALTGGSGNYQYQWEQSTNNSSWSSISNGTLANFSPPALTQSTYFRRIVSAPPCPATTSASVLISVENLIGNNLLFPSQTICNGQTPNLIQGSSPTGGSGLYTYSWQSSANASTWQNILPAVTTRDFVPGALTANTYYRRLVSAGICTASTSVTDTILVVPLIGATTIGSAQTICSGSIPVMLTGSTPTGGTGNFSYSWESSLNSLSWTTIPAASGSSYAPSALSTSVYFRRVVLSPPCSSVPGNAIRITVEVPPAPNVTGSSQTICFGQTPNVLTGTLPSGGNNSYAYQWLSSLNRAVWSTAGNGATYTSGPLTVTTYFRRVVQSGVCLPDSGNIIQTEVIPNLQGNNLSSSQTLCLGTAASVLTGPSLTGGTGLYSYQWESSLQSSVWSVIPGATQAGYAPGGMSATTYFRRLVASGICSFVGNTLLIEITPGISNNLILASQSVCSGQAPVLTGSVPVGGIGVYNYQWESSLDGSSWTVIPGGTQINYSAPGMTQPVFFRRSVTGFPCAAVYSNISQILILPLVGNNLIGNAQTICTGSSPQALTGSVPTGGTGVYQYQWESAASSIGPWSALSGASFPNYIAPALAQTTWFRRTITSFACQNASAPAEIWVNSLISQNSIGSDQTICQATAPLNLTGSTPSGGNGLYQYQWQSSSQGSVWNNVSGAQNIHYQPPVLQAGTYYRRVVTSAPCSPSTSASVWIRVDSLIGNNLIQFNQTICSGQQPGNLTGSLPSGGNGLYQYTWQSSVNSLAWNAVSGATQSGYQPPVLTQNAYYRRVVQAGVCAGETTAPVSILVLPAIQQDFIGSAQTICSGSTPSLLTGSLPSGGNGQFQYQWESSTNQSVWNSVAGATLQDFAPPALWTNTYFRRGVASGACTQFNSTLAITVLPLPGNNQISAAQTICPGVVPSLLTGSLPSGSTGIYSYQWESSTTGSSWVSISGASLSSYAPPALMQTAYYRRTVSSTPCAVIASDSVRILVLPPLGNNTIGNNQTICQGTAPQALTGSSPSGGDSAYSYQWESAPVPGLVWSSISGATFPALIAPVLNASTYYRRVVQSFNCVNTSAQVFVLVQPPIGGNSIANNQTICAGSVPALLQGGNPTGGNGSYGYQWESSLNNSSWSAIGGGSQMNLQPAALFQTTFFRRIVASPPCQASTSGVLTIVVEGLPGNNIISSNQTLCAGQFTSVLTGSIPSGGSGLYQYQWESSLNSSLWSVISGSTQTVLLPQSLQQTTYYRRVVASGVCPATTSNGVEILVFPALGQNSILPAQTICTGTAPVTISGNTPTGGNGLFAYQWLSSSNQQNWSVLAGATQIHFTGPVLTATTYYRRVVYSSSCADSSNSIRVWVEFLPGQNTIGSAQTLCSGQTFQALTGSIPSGGNQVYGYQWQSSPDSVSWGIIPGSIGQGMSGTGLTSSVYYRRVVSSGVCPAHTANPVLIQVFPGISQNLVTADQTICTGTAPQQLSGSQPLGGNGQYLYQWLSSRQASGPWLVLNGVVTQSWQPPVLTDTTYYRRMVASGGVCADSGNIVSVWVNPALGSNILQSTQTVCSGSIPAPLSGTQPSGGNGVYSYQWESSLTTAGFVPIPGATLSGFSPPVLTVTHYYQRVVSAGVCTPNTATWVMIRVDSLISNNQIGNNQTICAGQTPAAFSGTLPTGGNGVYAYQWESSPNGLAWSSVSQGTQQGNQSPVLNAHTYFRRRVNAGVCISSYSDSLLVWVDPAIQGNSIAPVQTICLGDSTSILTGVLPSGGNGQFVFAWESSTDGSNWWAIPGETASDLSPRLPMDTTYYRRIVVSRLCQDISNSATIITNQRLGSNSIASNQTLCSGQVPALLSGSLPSGGNGLFAYTWQSSPDSVSWTIIPTANQQHWQEGNLADSVWFRRTIQAGPCPSDTSSSVEIIVFPPIAGSGIFPDQTICSGSSFIALSGSIPSGGSGSYGYQWLSSPVNGNGPWQIMQGIQSPDLSGYALTSTTWYRRLTLSGGVCSDSGNVVRILVNTPIQQNTLLSNQTLCLGTSSGSLTGSVPTGGNGLYQYIWESSTDSVFWQVVPNQTGLNFPGVTLSQTHFFRRIVSSLPCPASTSAPVRVTIDFPIGFNSIIANQTICTGSAPALISGTIPTGGNGSYHYSWQTSPLALNWQDYSPSQSGRDFQPGVMNQTLLIRRLVTAGVCPGDTASAIRVEVEQPIGNNTVLSSQTVCQGVFPNQLSGTLPSGGSGVYTYAWESSGFPFNWVSISGETSGDYQPPFPVAVSYYRRVVQGGFCSPNTSVAVNLDFVPQIGDNIIFADQTICYAQQPGLLTGSFPSGGSGQFGFEWQMSIDNLNWATWGGGTQQNLNTGPMVFPLFFRRVVGSGSCIPSTSNFVYVHVFAPLGNNLIGPAQTLCSGGVPNVLTGTLPTGGTNSYTYQWQSSLNGLSAWTSIPGATGIFLSPGPLTQTTYYRRQIISGQCTGLGNGNSIRVVVLSVQSIGNNLITPAQSLCLNDLPLPLTGSVPTGGTGSYLYEWISSPDLITWQGNLQSSRDFNPPSLTASAYYRRVVSTGTCRPDTSVILPIIVYPRIGNNQLTGNQTLCAGSVPALLTGTIPTGGNGAYQFQWLVSTDSIQWLPAPGGTGQQYQTGALLSIQYFRRVVNSFPCMDTSNSLTLVPVPPIQNNTILASQTLCNGLIPFLLTGTAPSGGSGLYYYQWQSGPDSISWLDISGGTQSDCNPGVLYASTYFRRVVVSGPCADTSQVSLVTVWPMLGNNFIASNQTLCSGQLPSLMSGSIPTGGNGTIRFEWQESPNLLNWNVISGATSQNLQYPSLVTTQYFRRIISFAGCPSDTTPPLTLEAYPAVFSNWISASQTLCQGTTANTLLGSQPSGGTGQFIFQWLSSPTMSGPWTQMNGATQSDFNPGILGQTTFFRRLITSGGVCQDSSPIIGVQVIPRTTGNVIGPAQTLCSGNSFSTLSGPVPSGGTGNWSYIWQYSHDTLVWTDIFAQPNSFLPGYPLTTPMYFRRIAASWPCNPDTSAWVRIDVDLPVTGNFIQSDQTICWGQTPSPIFGSSPQQGNGQYFYQWESRSGNGLWTNISGATASGYASGTLFSTTWFRRRVSSGVCNQSVSDSIRIGVLPPITGNIIQANQTICLGQASAALSGTQPSGGNQVYQIQWYQQPLSQSGWTPLSGQQFNQLPALAFSESVRLRRVISSAQCVDSGNVVTVTVNPGIGDHLIASSQTLCNGALPAALTGTLPSGGNGLFSWQWETSSDGLNWQSLNGANQSAIQPLVPLNFLYYRRQAISPPCSPVYSNAIQLLPLPPIGNNSIQGNQTLCSGNIPAAIIGTNPSGGNSQYSFEWQSSTDNLNWVLIAGASTLDYQEGILIQSAYYRRIVQSFECRDTAAPVLVEVIPTPVITVADATICIGDSVFLQATAVPAGGLFTWNVPPFNSPGVWVTPSQNTTYSVDYGFNGCFAYADVEVTVNSLPIADIDYAGSVRICAGDSLQLSYAGPHGYQWTQNGNILAINSPLSVFNTGTYLLQVTDGNGCRGIDSITVWKGNPLVLQVNTSDPSCAGGLDGAATVTASGGFPPYQFLWSNGQQTPGITGLGWGTYQVLVEDSEGCVSSQQVILFSPNALMIQNIQTIPVNCFSGATGSATVSVTGGTPPYQYFWSTVPPQNSAGANGLKAGSYQVRIVDAQGCQTLGSAVIGQPASAISANITGPEPRCPGDSGVIQVTALGGTPPYQYQWSPDSGLEFTTEMLTRVYFDKPITYSVSITDYAGCVVVKNYTLPVLPVPKAQFSVLYETPDSILRNQTPVQIRNYSTPLPLRYWWDFGDSTGVDSVFEPSYQYFITDTYQITLMVQNSFGCRDTAYRWVDYRNVPFIHFPNAFSPNGDGVNDYFSIASLNLTGFTIRIFDRWGNLVYISENPDFRWDGALAGKGLPEGAYTFYFTGSGINGEKIEASGVVTLIR